MTVDKKKIVAAILTPFRESGWKERGSSVFSTKDDVAAVVNVQGSPYSAQQYINVGFWFPEVNNDSLVPEHKCPINRRLERMCPAVHELIVVGANAETSTPELLGELSGFMRDDVEPFIRRLLSREALKEALEAGALGNGLTSVEAKKILKIPVRG